MADNSFPVVVGLGLLGVAALGFINSNKAGEETTSSSLGFSPFDSSSYGSSGSTSGVSGAVSGGGTGTVTNPAVNPGLVQGYAPQQNYAAENAAGYDAAAFAFAPTSKQATLDPAGEGTQQSGSSGADDGGVVRAVDKTPAAVSSVKNVVSSVGPVLDDASLFSLAGTLLVGSEGYSQYKEERDTAVTNAVVSGYTDFVLGAAETASSVSSAAESVSSVVDTASTVAKTTAAVVNPIGAVAGYAAKTVVGTVSSWLGGLFK